MEKQLSQLCTKRIQRAVTVRGLGLMLLALGLICASLPANAGKKKKPEETQGPYVTAEQETPPAVNAADLAYRGILFESCTIPAKWEKHARTLVDDTTDHAKSRLNQTKAFTKIGATQDTAPEEPYLVVKCALKDYRLRGVGSKIMLGVVGGSDYVILTLKVNDGKSGTMQFQRDVSTENNAFVATFSNSEGNLARYLGNYIGDYLALRARTDKGVNVLPLGDGEQGGTAPAK